MMASVFDSPLSSDIVSKSPVCLVSYVVSCLLPKWRLHIIKKSPWNILNIGCHEFVRAGSKAEDLDISSGYYHRLLEGQPTVSWPSDDDVLVVYKIPCTIGPDIDHGCHIRLDTTVTKPGYVRVEHRPHDHQKGDACEIVARFGRVVEQSCTSTARSFIDLSTEKELLVNRVRNDILSRYRGLTEDQVQPTLSGPAVTLDHLVVGKLNDGLESVLRHDYTLSLKCHYWPKEASEWPMRSRPADWPSISLIRNIMDEGCYLVQVPHMYSCNPSVEWRFSFTVGERKLAHSMSEAQRRCYIAFKTVVSNKLRPSKVVSSYCLKNILFWKLEQTPASVWENKLTGLGIGFLILLEGLIHCLAEHNIPHYFIKENNLIEHKARDTITYVLRQVLTLRRWPIQEILNFDYVNRLSSSIREPLSEVLEDIIPIGNQSAERLPTILEYQEATKASISRRLRFIAMDSWDNDFSEAMTEGETIQSSFFRNYINAYPNMAVVTEADYKDEDAEKARYITGVPWGCFIHAFNSRSQEEAIVLAADIEEMFELAIERVQTFDEKYHLAHVTARFTVFLQRFEKNHKTVGVGQKILSTMPLDVRWFVCISNQSSKVFDDYFQEALGQTPFTALTVTAMLCHVLIGSCLSLNMSDKAREHVLPLYEEHCQAFYDSDRSQAKVTAVFLFYLLARSLERLGMYEKAIEKYGLVYRKHMLDEWRQKVQKRIECCTKEMTRIRTPH